MTSPARRWSLAFALLASCGGAGGDPGVGPRPDPVVGAVALATDARQTGVAGLPLHDSIAVRVTDRAGAPMPGVWVRFSPTGGVASPAVARTDAQGVARSVWTLGSAAGEQTVAASVEGLAPVVVTATAAAVSAPLLDMLRSLDGEIRSAAQSIRASLPNNPALSEYASAKLAMLAAPTLAADIVRDHRWVEDSTAATSGRLAIVAVVPLDSLRGEAQQSVRTVAGGIPLLERFVGIPFPRPEVRIWEGFVFGNSGGGGTLTMEDRATYEARTTATRSPYDAILLHECAHSWVANESLTQFLELYAYNVPRAGTAARSWAFTRGWTPARDTNAGVHALLDVYELIGADAMARAYRAAVALHPPYGEPLPPAVRQAFVDEAPAALRAQVAAKLATIGS